MYYGQREGTGFAVLDPRFKPALLLLVTNLKPNFEELDTIFHNVFLHARADFEKASVLFRSAEAHHVLDASAVVPTPLAGKRTD